MNRIALSRACPWAKYRRIILIIGAFERGYSRIFRAPQWLHLKRFGPLVGNVRSWAAQ